MTTLAGSECQANELIRESLVAVCAVEVRAFLFFLQTERGERVEKTPGGRAILI